MAWFSKNVADFDFFNLVTLAESQVKKEKNLKFQACAAFKIDKIAFIIAIIE